jgi:hypothetical protein
MEKIIIIEVFLFFFRNYNTTVLNLQTRIIKIYNKSMHSERTTFASVYGAVVGLAELGNEVKSIFLYEAKKK